jgi:NAD(P)-dependent dehydrogenase (short-subunit alcohol dehydrogenase family)
MAKRKTPSRVLRSRRARAPHPTPAPELVPHVAVVTGGAQGIGRAIVERLLADGLQVAALDVDAEACTDLAASRASPRLLVVRTDVAREASVRRAFRHVLDGFGRIDALVNNAAIAEAVTGPLADLALAEWNRRLGVGLTGAFLCAKHAIPALNRQGGAIVNIASTRALQSEPDSEAYAATKGGLVAFTHALAISLGPAVRVNCISPGWIAVDDWKKPSARTSSRLRPQDHRQHPAGRVGRPEDIAAMVAYLLSAQAGFLTGQNVVIDGGMTRKMIYV